MAGDKTPSTQLGSTTRVKVQGIYSHPYAQIKTAFMNVSRLRVGS